MASGYFPLSSTDVDGVRLLEAAETVEKICAAYRGAIWGGDDGQFDNSASDGGAGALLQLAARIIRGEVREAS